MASTWASSSAGNSFEALADGGEFLDQSQEANLHFAVHRIQGRSMIALLAHADGWLLPVRAQPGARKNAVVGEHAGALKVAVSAPPEDGRANKALIETLAKLLQVKRAQIR